MDTQTLQNILDRYYSGGYEDDIRQRSSTNSPAPKGSAASQAAVDLLGTIKKHKEVDALPTFKSILGLLKGAQCVTADAIMQAVVAPAVLDQPARGESVGSHEVSHVPTPTHKGVLSPEMREDLIDLLLLIPGMEDTKVRTQSLTDIPVEVDFHRADSLRADLACLVDALATKPLLLTFLDNLQAEELPGAQKTAIERLYNEVEATDATPDQPTLLGRVLRALKSIFAPRRT